MSLGLATIVVQEKSTPCGSSLPIPANPNVAIFCPPGSPNFQSKCYSDDEVATMMGTAELNAYNFSNEAARLAVVNYHINLGFRYKGVLFVPSSKEGEEPTIEYHMEMPPDFSQNHEA